MINLFQYLIQIQTVKNNTQKMGISMWLCTYPYLSSENLHSQYNKEVFT